MNIPDLINGGYESIGGLFVLNNCRALFRDKLVRGVSLTSTALFTSWGLWNLYYYPFLGQWLSFSGGLVIVTGNAIWLSMALYYSRQERKRLFDQSNDIGAMEYFERLARTNS